jgi:hypothetical protein
LDKLGSDGRQGANFSVSVALSPHQVVASSEAALPPRVVAQFGCCGPSTQVKLAALI